MFHDVLVVGYGDFDGRRVFKFRNSWGTNWGDNGYGYIHINEFRKGVPRFINTGYFPIIDGK